MQEKKGEGELLQELQKDSISLAAIKSHRCFEHLLIQGSLSTQVLQLLPTRVFPDQTP